MEKLYDSELKVMEPLWAEGPQTAGALAKKLAQALPQYQPLEDQLAGEAPRRPQPMKKKKPRAQRKPAVPET